ncbi:MAG: efflux RND transporter periplasmic adaptor subunit, partial [Microvirga sp.]
MKPLVRLALGAALCVVAASAALAQPPQAHTPAAPAVTVVRAAERDLVERAIVTGTLVPREEILVAPEVEGYRIAEVLVEEGSVVKQGQVLARLSRDVLETQLAQNAATRTRAEAAIAQARSNIVQAEAAQVEASQALERARALMRGGNTTEATLEQRVSVARAAEGRLSAARDGLRIAEAERASAQAQQREIEWRLSRTEIRAPAPGVVARKNARVGATASAAGESLFRIIMNGEIELEGEVTEVQMPRLREGAEAQVTIDGQRFIAGRIR